jgi:hypothetical protein
MKIEDYALIGDCHTSALVGCNGSTKSTIRSPGAIWATSLKRSRR